MRLNAQQILPTTRLPISRAKEGPRCRCVACRQSGTARTSPSAGPLPRALDRLAVLIAPRSRLKDAPGSARGRARSQCVSPRGAVVVAVVLKKGAQYPEAVLLLAVVLYSRPGSRMRCCYCRSSWTQARTSGKTQCGCMPILEGKRGLSLRGELLKRRVRNP
jgi:hypothetical protein